MIVSADTKLPTVKTIITYLFYTKKVYNLMMREHSGIGL
jgi:hypothetical protein